MKSTHSFSLNACGLALAFSALVLAGRAQAAVTYEFNTGASNFDGGEGGDLGQIGQSESILDAAVGVTVTLTTMDIIGWDLTMASTGTDNRTNITSNSLGINTVDNGAYATEANDFNLNEAWVFKFNVAVHLGEIDLASQGAGTQMTVSSSAFPSFVLDDGVNDADTHDLGNTFVPAGTAITIQMTAATGADQSIRISYLTVSAAPVPEPGTALLSLLGSSLLLFRRRH